MRRKLLGGVTEDKPQWKDYSDSEEDGNEKETLDVNFGVGFGEDIGKKLIERK